MRRLLPIILAATFNAAADAQEAQSGQAPAPVPPIVHFVIALDQAAGRHATEIDFILKKLLSSRKDVTAIDPASAYGVVIEEIEHSNLKRAAKILEQAKKDYDNLELTVAIEKLRESIALMKAAPNLIDKAPGYAEALKFLAAGYVLYGDSDKADETFNELLIFDEDTKLDPHVFPPKIFEALNYAKQQFRDSDLGEMTVQSQPAYAEVYVNGTYRGVAPLKIKKLHVGPYYVRVEKTGQAPVVTTRRLGSHPETVTLVMKEAPDPNEISSKLRKAAAEVVGAGASSAAEIGRLAGAARILVCVVQSSPKGASVKAKLFDAFVGRTLADAQDVMAATNFGDKMRRVSKLLNGLFERAAKGETGMPDRVMPEGLGGEMPVLEKVGK